MKTARYAKKWLSTMLIFPKKAYPDLQDQKKDVNLQRLKHNQIGVLAHLVERNTGSVEVSGSSPLYST